MAADNGAPARFKQSPARPVDAGSNETNYTRQRPADAASVVPLVRQPDASFAKERCFFETVVGKGEMRAFVFVCFFLRVRHCTKIVHA